MRTRSQALTFAAVLLASAATRGESWRSGALATSALEHLESWPGAPAPPGLGVQFATARPFLGSGISVHTLRLQRSSARHAWAAAFEQWRSDIHVESEVTAALQVARGPWRAGVAAGVRESRFERYAPWRTVGVRLGAGRQVGEALRVAATWGWWQQEHSTLGVAAACKAARHLELSLQVEREPALPARWRTGVAWSESGGSGLLCGYDVSTAAITSGVVVGAGAWRLTWAGLAHPDLGWSHTWILAYGR